MRQRIGPLFAVAVISLYLALSAPVLVMTVTESLVAWLLFAVLYELLALGIALELTELSFAYLLPPTQHPKAAMIDRRHVRVAALYVCRDDVDEESLQALERLHGVDVFILDDSQDPRLRQRLDRSGRIVVRRPERTGYKAGNLNYWLSGYSDGYKYFVVLDSDSLITTEAIWELVSFAEHHQNQDVAIVQSSIHPRPGNCFQRLVGSQATVRLRILSRLYDRMGWTLSHGHNNLHRTRAIRAFGGFGLSATCEDTVTSLELYRNGWRTILVDTITHDGEPRNVFAFCRRTVRWARQTADVITAFRHEVTWLHGWLMARHLLSYMLPSTCIGLLALISLTTDLTPQHAWHILGSNLMLKSGHVASGILGYLLWTTFLLTLALRLHFFLLNGGNFRDFCKSTVLSGAVSAFCTFPLLLGLLRSFLLDRSEFTPTGMPPARSLRFIDICKAMALPWMIYMGIAALLFSKPGLLIFGFNLIWSTGLVTAPLILWHFHQDQIVRPMP